MRRSYLLLVALPILLAGKCKDKKVTDEDEDIGVVTPPTVSIQVISIDPDQVDPGTSFRATIYGSAFQDGAEVSIGGTPIASVNRNNSNSLTVSVPPLDQGVYDVRVKNPDGESATLRSGLRVEPSTVSTGNECNDLRINFAYDSSVVDAGAQQTLRSKLSCFTDGGASVRVEGHCDDRGTTDYNIALGQRRAEAVQRYLIAQGVPPSRLRVVSYGEERPLARGSDESSYAQNRRAEIVVSR
jgi:peptidoglycan-associated lipoprotein